MSAETIFLKFPSEKKALQELDDYNDHGEWITDSHKHSLSVVGVIYHPGELDEEGNEVTKPKRQPGFHINWIGELPAHLEKYIIHPKKPRRIF